MKKWPLVLLASSLILFSCKKELDDQLPDVTFNSPADGIQVNIYDTLHVSLHLTDNEGLSSVAIKLIDPQATPVLQTISYSLHGKSADVNFDYPVDNFRLTSGYYYLSVELTDDNHNLRRVYRNIWITEIPKRLNGFFTASPLVNNLKIYKVDTNWTPSLWSATISDFTDLAVSNYWQQVYVAGNYSGPLRALSIDGQQAGWAITPFVTSTPYWGPITVEGKQLWISYHSEGKFKSIDQSGQIKFNASADNGFYVRHILPIGDHVFTEQKDISSANVRMAVYSTMGGSIQESPLSVDVLEMFERDANNVYVVGNSGGQGHLLVYDFTTNGTWEPVTLPAGTATSAAQVDSNTVLIGMSSGTIYKFTYNPVGLLPWTSGITPTNIRYDDVDNQVFSAEGTNVKVYNYNPFSLQRTIVLPDSVKDLELWFNR